MNKIKKLIAYLLSWSLYWLGDGVSRIMHLANIFGILYPIYNTLMIWSGNVQDWAGNETPWIHT